MANDRTTFAYMVAAITDATIYRSASANSTCSRCAHPTRGARARARALLFRHGTRTFQCEKLIPTWSAKEGRSTININRVEIRSAGSSGCSMKSISRGEIFRADSFGIFVLRALDSSSSIIESCGDSPRGLYAFINVWAGCAHFATRRLHLKLLNP